jgi:cell fate regulator YaaT (PSP1 superfamily)
MADVVGIKFRKSGKVYYFDPSGIELDAGDYAVVRTNRGAEIGQIVMAPTQVNEEELQEPLEPVLRRAEEKDIEKAREMEEKSEEAFTTCNRLIEELGLPMKLLSADYNLEGNRATFLFGAESRVDFRELVRKLSGQLKVRVELRQIGSRDRAKLVGGFGRCGRPMCCACFLDDFAPVSIRMAKDQDLPLNPMKISGMCGRLMCCLGYENDFYHEMRHKLPRAGKRVSTSMGEATVISASSLKETVLVQLESEATVELPLSEISGQ